jgi:hypothetical protein
VLAEDHLTMAEALLQEAKDNKQAMMVLTRAMRGLGLLKTKRMQPNQQEQKEMIFTKRCSKSTVRAPNLFTTNWKQFVGI